jgi:hypothetical protein
MADPTLETGAAPLLGGRVLELAPDGRYWRLSVTRLDGRDRRQVGGFDISPDEIPLFMASVSAMATYAKGAHPEREHLRGDRAA